MAGQAEGGTPPPGGEGLDDFELIDPFELEEWSVVSFTDPRDQSVYDIIDGRVLIAFKNAPVLPQVDPNYFDVERFPNDPFYSEGYPPLVGDTAVDSFIAAEQLEVYSEWLAVGGIGAVLPEGQSVADAVANWPSEYPDLIECVDPDALVSTCDMPEDPNDDWFGDQWAVNEDGVSDFHIRLQDAWRHPGGYGSASVVVAVLDSGVTYDLVDMQPNSTLYGAACGDKRSSTRVKLRTEGGGEPSPTWADWSIQNAIDIGHGTLVAGIISAAIDNDPGERPVYDDGRDTAGVARYARYFPVEMKFKGEFSMSAAINAFAVVGQVKRIYQPYSCGLAWVPHYNIEIVNCTFGTYHPSYLLWREINNLWRYMLFVCSAGNEGYEDKIPFPASHGGALSVAAYNVDGMRAGEAGKWSSNFATGISIAAPGLRIRSTDVPGVNSYGYKLGYVADPLMTAPGFGGTSAAAPHAAGVAALVASKYPAYTPLQIKYQIMQHGMPLPDDDFNEHGILGLDADATLNPP